MSRPFSFANPRFVLAAARTEDFLSRPAVAFAGRSNAGKSSAINALCGGKFARVSAAPGRTRAVNFFAVGPESRPRLLADLPGYGYAAASKKERAALARLIQSFIQNGEIAGLVLIIDCRRGIGEMDDKILRQLRLRGVRLLAVLSKSDKLKRGALARAQVDAEKHLARAGFDAALVLPFSALQKTGVQKLRAEIAATLRGAKTNATDPAAARPFRAEFSPPPPPPSGGSHP